MFKRKRKKIIVRISDSEEKVLCNDSRVMKTRKKKKKTNSENGNLRKYSPSGDLTRMFLLSALDREEEIG